MKPNPAHRLVCIVLLVLSPRLFAAETRPNFLFILTDDQRWDGLGVVQAEQGDKARFPWLRTPNLDKLAGEGVRFRNAFVVNSLCSPSRASFLTGTYGCHNGVNDNLTRFPADNVTFASVLRSAGYRTGYVGKWHMDGQKGPRPGFDYSASYVGQGKHFDCPFEVNGRQVESEGWVDDVAIDYAVEFLRQSREAPFLLAIGFKACHGPFTPPPRYTSAYAGLRPRPVPNLDLKPPFHELIEPTHESKAGFVWKDSPELLAYLQFTAAIDENVGRLLEELNRLGLAENTVVVFAGDNGYYLGEHGLADKRSAYEESLRIPLLVRYPRLPAKGRLIDGMVLNIDLAPTLIDLAGVPVPSRMQGRSWRPLLEGKKTDWRKSFYYEYLPERRYPIPRVQAIRTEKAKLILYPGHPEWMELFDLIADPYETRNLINDPAWSALRQELETELQHQRNKVQCDKPATRPASTRR